MADTTLPADVLLDAAALVKGRMGFLYNSQQRAAASNTIKHPHSSFSAGFFSTGKEDVYRKLKNHRKVTYSKDTRDGKALFITSATVAPNTLADAKSIDAGTSSFKGLGGLGEGEALAGHFSTLAHDRTKQKAFTVAASPAALTEVTYRYESLHKRISLAKYNLKITIVVCGLYSKSFVKPKNCFGKKTEQEAVR